MLSFDRKQQNSVKQLSCNKKKINNKKNRLNKQVENIQPWCAPFSIWNQAVAPCPVLNVACWLAYRFLRRQITWSGIPVSLRIFHSLSWSTVKGFGVVNEAEVNVFLELSCFCYNLRMLAILSLVPLPFLNPAWTPGSSRFRYSRSLAWRILGITLWLCKMSAIVWWFEHSLAFPFFGIGMKTDLFQLCAHCCFPNLLADWV